MCQTARDMSRREYKDRNCQVRSDIIFRRWLPDDIGMSILKKQLNITLAVMKIDMYLFDIDLYLL